MKLKPLTPRQANALQLILEGHSKGEVCEKIGITQKTLWNWRRLPAWDEQVTVALKESSGDGQAQVKTLLPMATGVLRRLLLTASDQVKLGAARTVLEAHAHLVDRENQQEVLSELEERLEELRSAIQQPRLSPDTHEVMDVEIESKTRVSASSTDTQESEAQSQQGIQAAAMSSDADLDRIGQESAPIQPSFLNSEGVVESDASGEA